MCPRILRQQGGSKGAARRQHGAHFLTPENLQSCFFEHCSGTIENWPQGNDSPETGTVECAFHVLRYVLIKIQHIALRYVVCGLIRNQSVSVRRYVSNILAVSHVTNYEAPLLLFHSVGKPSPVSRLIFIVSNIDLYVKYNAGI